MVTLQSAHTVVFARLPVAGVTKTRLAATIGGSMAAEFYKLCAEHVYREVSRCAEASAAVYSAAAGDVPSLQLWLQDNRTPLPVYPQLQSSDLGQRMLAALTDAAASFSSAQQEWHTACHENGHQCHPRVSRAASDVPYDQSHQHQQQQQQQLHQANISVLKTSHTHAMRKGGTKQADLACGLPPPNMSARTAEHHDDAHLLHSAVVVVGTDIPDLSADILSAAIHSITQQGYEMVLGPAKDGGFYLLGFSTAALLKPEVQAGSVFEGVVWSSSSVLQRTVTAAQKLGLNVAPLATLPALRDIDILEDLQTWWQEQAGKHQHKQDSCATSLADQQNIAVAHPCSGASHCAQGTVAAAEDSAQPCKLHEWVAALLARHNTV